MPHAAKLEMNGLHKAFAIKGVAQPILNNINLSIRPGEFVSIVGASGCGKSTLLRLIAGLDNDYSGELRVDGESIDGPSLARGIVFQEHRLFPWLTVAQNVSVGLLNNKALSDPEKAASVREHIGLVGLRGFEDAYPHQLSGGMAQRVAIARALVNRPEILVLDEPLGALDAFTRFHLQNELQQIWAEEGVTMILVTHDIEEAVYLGDRAVILESRPGRIKQIVDIDLPRPRDRSSPDFHRISDEILAEFPDFRHA